MQPAAAATHLQRVPAQVFAQQVHQHHQRAQALQLLRCHLAALPLRACLQPRCCRCRRCCCRCRCRCHSTAGSLRACGCCCRRRLLLVGAASAAAGLLFAQGVANGLEQQRDGLALQQLNHALCRRQLGDAGEHAHV
jgi:hypothetical protein